MSSVGESLRAYLIADTSGVYAVVGGRVHQNHVPIISTFPHIWFGRSGDEHLTCLDGGTGFHRAMFDVECIAGTADAADDLAILVTNRLHGTINSTGTITLHAALVEDHDDAYEPKGVGDDSGNHVSALSVRILYS